jgi:hypothetical protein
MTRLVPVVLVLLTVAAPATAADNPVVQTYIEEIAADAWTISGFDSTLELTDAGLSGEFRIARIVLKQTNRTFDDVRIGCELIRLTTRTVGCTKAAFTADIPAVGRQTVGGSFTYDRYTHIANLRFLDAAIAGGRVRADVRVTETGFEVRYAGTQLQLDGLLVLAGKFSDALTAYSASGIADVSGTIDSPSSGPLHIVAAATLSDTSIANAAGTVATDGIGGTFDLEAEMDAGNTNMSLRFAGDRGEAYIEPVYANLSEHALRLQAEDVVTSDFAFFDVGRFELQQASLLDADGSGTLLLPEEADAPVSISADVSLHDAAVSNLYASLVQVRFAGTLFGNLDTDGRVTGAISLAESALRSATLELDKLILDDRGDRFAVYGLSGNLDWSADESTVAAASRLRWDSGSAHNIIVGGGEMNLQLGNNDIEMLAPVRIPAMGGALVINELALHDFGSDDATGTLDAELEPVQLSQLAGAFGWPAFSGTLSGSLPSLQLAENTITVGGILSARAFDGAIELSDLEIEQPFGRVPRMRGEMTFRNLDLQRVTEAFSFGLIQGRLSVDVAGLELENWRPVAMDLHIYTPADDKAQHRISQRAVENLANIGGGGAAAVLSTGFLQFFEVFAYDRIGLRCLLRNGVCAMSGAGPARTGPQGVGYYIVKGSGLPRIDVVGYRDTVSWPRLVQQLAAITRSGSPTVN